MSVGLSSTYRVLDIAGRHSVEIGKRADFDPTVIRQVIRDEVDRARQAPARVLERMPADFPMGIHESVEKAINGRLHLLESGLANI